MEVVPPGIEPRTPRVSDERSTAELRDSRGTRTRTEMSGLRIRTVTVTVMPHSGVAGGARTHFPRSTTWCRTRSTSATEECPGIEPGGARRPSAASNRLAHHATRIPRGRQRSRTPSRYAAPVFKTGCRPRGGAFRGSHHLTALCAGRLPAMGTAPAPMPPAGVEPASREESRV